MLRRLDKGGREVIMCLRDVVMVVVVRGRGKDRTEEKVYGRGARRDRCRGQEKKETDDT